MGYKNMRLKKFEQLNENKDNGISVYDIWVIQSYSGSDIQTVYLNKEEAEKEAEKLKLNYFNHYRKVNKMMSDDEYQAYFNEHHAQTMFKVVNLDDAIDAIKDEIRDDYNSHDNESY